jgi:hypothetical protein
MVGLKMLTTIHLCAQQGKRENKQLHITNKIIYKPVGHSLTGPKMIKALKEVN